MGLKPISCLRLNAFVSVIYSAIFSVAVFVPAVLRSQDALAEAKSSFGAGYDPGRNAQRPQTVAAASMRQLLSLVEYIGSDYAGAVAGEAGSPSKVINQVEYEEVSQFTQASLEAFAVVAKARPKTVGLATIEQELVDLKAAVAAKKSPSQVQSLARSAREHLIDAFKLTLAPAQAPLRALATAAFETNCAACHGATGRGDGVLSAKLEPRPRNFADPDFAQGNSPFKSFNVLHTGVAGTPMPSFAERLNGNEIWSLAFWISGIPHDQKASLASLPQAVRDELKSKISLELLSRASDHELAAWVNSNIQALSKSKTTVANVMAALRVDAPFDGGFVRKSADLAVAGTTSPGGDSGANSGPQAAALQNTINAVNEAVGLANQAQFDLAKSKLLDAYLVGFEPVEKSLRLVDPAVVIAVEQQFIAARATLSPLTAAPIRQAAMDGLMAALFHAQKIQTAQAAQAQIAASGAGGTDGTNSSGDFVLRISQQKLADFFASFLIIFREGFEAFLIIAALLAALGNMGMASSRKWIHAGWGSAVVLGIATFFAFNHLIHLSGMGRELVEAIATGLAAAVLFYVGFWLLSQAERSQWDKFIRGGARDAVSSGKVWTLAGLAFIAVYREAAETVLFYNALSHSAQSGAAVVAGFVMGTACLGGICFAIHYFGLRMPLRKFFLSTSFLMVGLSVVLAGKAVVELVEAGVLQPARLSFMPTVNFLGIYPYVQTLMAQGFLLAIAGGFWVWKKQASTKLTSLALSTVERSGN